MAADYLAVDRSRQLGNALVRAADLLSELGDLIDKLSSIGNHCFNGADYTVFEARFGLVAGTGANALSLLNLIQTILNSNTDVTGANRLSQLKEFIARVAGQ